MPRHSPKDTAERRARIQDARQQLADAGGYDIRGPLTLPERVLPATLEWWRNAKPTGGAMTLETLKAFAAAHWGARGVAASAQPTETQTAARDSAAADGGTCQANTDAAPPQSPSGVGTCAQDAIASGGGE